MFIFDNRWHQMPEVPLRIIVKFVEDFWKIEEERKRQEKDKRRETTWRYADGFGDGWRSYGDRGCCQDDGWGGFGDRGNSSSSDDDWGGFGDRG